MLEKKDERKKVRCYKCKKLGHKAFECTSGDKRKKCDVWGLTNHETKDCRKRKREIIWRNICFAATMCLSGLAT